MGYVSEFIMKLTYQIKHFSLEEIACPCCGLMNIHPMTIKKLDLLRDALGHSIWINSACRCEIHNAEVGGKKNSTHICTSEKYSHAFDLKIKSDADRFQIARKAMAFGFHRIGVYKTFIHIDDDITKRPALWVG